MRDFKVNLEEAKLKLSKYGQKQILRYYDELSDDEKNALLEQIDKTDMEVLSAIEHKSELVKKGEITPLDAMELDEIAANYDTFKNTGVEAIKAGKVGAILLAGGMGTRLGSDNPKGMYNVGVNKELYIFECLINNLMDVVKETLEIMDEWGADAIRDCDGTEFPQELRDTGAKVYATYYTTRKDNAWAKANPDEIQQMYIMTKFHTAVSDTISIHLMDNLYPDMLKVNNRDGITRWWEVIDRTTGEVVSPADWTYDEESGNVTINNATPFHEYTVSFLAYIMWDPVHMYNAVVNEWDVEPQITFDVRQPKTKAHSLERLRKFLDSHEYVDVVRFTTFFHQFTLIFDEHAREKLVDWFGYSASVSPYILEQFEKEVGYKFRPEFIIDQGYMNNTYRIPSKEFKDFQAFQRREVAKLAKEMVDIVHEYGKEAMMFMGDHWIGMEPFMDEFASIGLDAVVGSVGNGATLRLFSDIKNVKYTEGRFLLYFFPDVFCEGGDPIKEAKVNWVTARRAILRSPIQRIGYGGYLKLALKFPDFVDYIKSVCNEFRTLYDNIQGVTPYCVKKVAVLNCWGKMRA